MKWKITKKRPWTGAVLHKGQKQPGTVAYSSTKPRKKIRKCILKTEKQKHQVRCRCNLQLRSLFLYKFG